MTPVSTLKTRLHEWTDWDGAAYELGICLGVMPENYFVKAKHVFWSDHPIGKMLYSTLDLMAEHGVLEKRDEPDFQYRWNSSFQGSWE